MTRHDLRQITKDALAAALQMNLIDAADLIELGHNHGTDEGAILQTLTEFAYANRHTAGGRAVHSVMCRANDAWHAAQAAAAAK